MFGFLKNVLPVIGGAVGFVFGGVGGAIKGAALGSALAGSKKKRPPKATYHRQHEGSRLETLKVQISSYGEVIPKIYGTVRLAGNIIWATDIKESKDVSNEYRENEQQIEVDEITNYSYCVGTVNKGLIR